MNIMISKMAITYLLLVIVFIDLAQTAFTDVPPPPKRPQHFHSKQELKKYLQKLHEYHSIVDRWRVRRSYNDHPLLNASDDDLFKFFDINNDHCISNNEFIQRLKFTKSTAK